MAATYDLCVVGAGLVGSAIARHASAKPGIKVCLIGPAEPKKRECVTGQEIFGAHYDNGRNTLSVDQDPVWDHLSKMAVAKYKDIEAKSGIRFFSNVGTLWVGDAKSNEVFGKRNGIEQLYPNELVRMYPYLKFGKDDVGYLDRGGGVINPRAQLAASILIASKNECDVIRDVVHSVSKADRSGSTIMILETENGKTIHAKQVILATNVFTGSRNLLSGVKVMFEASPQTVVFAEVAQKDLELLSDMPSVIYHGYGCSSWYKDYPRHPDGQMYYYMLPPIQYPDGKYYVKIGHSDTILKSYLRKDDISKWHCSGGDPWLIDNLTKLVKSMFTGIEFKSFHSDACVTMVTPTGYPYIDKIHGNLGVAIGGNGTSAKVCDEIGFVATEMMTSSSWNYGISKEYFQVVLEDEKAKL